MKLSEIIDSQPIPSGTSFQKAELIALTRALTLIANKRANIYTDSKYTFHIICSHAAILKQWGLLFIKGCPITNTPFVFQLLNAGNMSTEVGSNIVQVTRWPHFMGQQCHRQRSKISLTPITCSTTHSNPQQKASFLPCRKTVIITRGSTTTRREVTKTELLSPPQISGHTDSYGHSSGPTYRHQTSLSSLKTSYHLS